MEERNQRAYASRKHTIKSKSPKRKQQADKARESSKASPAGTTPPASRSRKIKDQSTKAEFSSPSNLKGPVSGQPALIQSTYGNLGNFDVVIPRPDGGLAHYWRNNDIEDLPWQGPEIFGLDAGFFDGVSLIQSNFGFKGNLELLAVDIGCYSLMHFWQETGLKTGWKGPVHINERALVSLFQEARP